MASRKGKRAKPRPAPPRYTAAQKIEHVLARGEVSARELAKKLRVKESTFRNRRRGVGELTEAQARKLTKLAAEARQETRYEARRQGIAPPKGVTLPVPAKRLQKRVEPARAPPKRKAAPPARVPGQIIELALEGLNGRAIFAALKPYRDEALRKARGKWPGMFRFVLKFFPGKMSPELRRQIKEESGSDPVKVQREKKQARQRLRAKLRERGEKLPPLREPEMVQMGTPYIWTAVELDVELWEAISDTLKSGAARIIAARIYPPDAR